MSLQFINFAGRPTFQSGVTCNLCSKGIGVTLYSTETGNSQRQLSAHEAMGETMRNFGRVSLIFALAVLADGIAAHAQGYAYYNRLTDSPRQDSAPLSSLGIPVSRSGASLAVARTKGQRIERGPYRDEQATRDRAQQATLDRAQQGRRVARLDTNTSVARTVYETRELDHYTAESVARAEAQRSEIPVGSTWEQQPRQPVSPPPVEVIPRTERHDYYPNMRTGMTPQPPVTLTANRAFFYPGCHCTLSRSMALAGAAHHR